MKNPDSRDAQNFGMAPYELPIDSESEQFLGLLASQERLKANRVPGVRTVLFILSSRAMPYDMESLRQKTLLAYPDAAVFFRTTQGMAAGMPSPAKVDLLLDFTGPRQRQSWFYARRLRGMARVTIGRNAGIFRKSIYDRIFDEKAPGARVPEEMFERERFVQRAILELAGIALAQMGDASPDLGASIALDLPNLKKMV